MTQPAHTPCLPGMIRDLLSTGDLESRVANLNWLRGIIAQHSPFASEPVDHVRWVKADDVHGNDYNPNVVAPPEMELLRLSVQADGYTQPVVTMPDDTGHVVVDGFHRTRIAKEYPDITARVHGYIPVVQIRDDRTSTNDRMASTIRHNRARGKHQVSVMSDIVIELKRRNWSNERVAKELGMDADEVLRLCQMTGLAELFADEDFSDSWDVDALPTEDAEAIAEIDSLQAAS